MKKASRYLKQLFSAIVAVVKARSTAVGSKASSLRTRLILLGIMRNKKLLLSAIQTKIHAIMGAGAGSGRGGYGNAAVAIHHGGGGDDDEGASRGGAAGEHGDGHHLASRKAAVLQSLPSFVVEQETRAVVLLSSLPSFALERDGGQEKGGDGTGGAEGDEKHLVPAGGSAAMEVAAECGGGGEFRLEDEIDRVADVFIRRFHDQMKLQKLESFKRFCEMLERGA